MVEVHGRVAAALCPAGHRGRRYTLGRRADGGRLRPLIDSGEVGVVGREVVDGVQTVHYAETLSMQVMLEKNPAMTDKAREEVLRSRLVLGEDPVAIDVWIGPDDLPVKQVSVNLLRTPGPAKSVRAAQPVVVSTTSYYSGWGEPVDLTAPPANEVRDAGEALPPPLDPKVSAEPPAAVSLPDPPDDAP
ncbi:hypothetical protein [Streptodolium elevatio]